jgi:hypothetical protein
MGRELALCQLQREQSEPIHEPVKGSAIRALIKRKKTLLSDFFLNRFCRSFSKGFATLTRTCVFVVLNRNTDRALLGEAIRSVSHLVLARWWLMPGLPTFEPKGADRIAPALAPSGSVFLVNRSTTTRARFGKRAFTSPAPIPPPAGPENLQCRAAFIQFHRAVVPRSPRGFRSPTRF